VQKNKFALISIGLFFSFFFANKIFSLIDGLQRSRLPREYSERFTNQALPALIKEGLYRTYKKELFAKRKKTCEIELRTWSIRKLMDGNERGRTKLP
jgi:hypothetical protein